MNKKVSCINEREEMIMKMKKILTLGLCAVMAVTTLVSCGGNSSEGGTPKGDITVVSREEGSGTRGAFTELVGVVDSDDNDITVSTAEITNSTSVMMQTVAGNESAIGYVSLGSLSDEAKAVKVDGVEATVDNIKSGDYKVSRPFNIVTKKSGVSELAQDFQKYILSEEGQKTIEEEGYIREDKADDYKASGLTGKLTIAGSTSVAPVMEVLAENYKKLNDGVEIEIQQSGSSAGITAAIEGVCDIGMSSRELEKSETKQGLVSTKIALDGIAVIVNNSNGLEDISTETLQKIYTGKITTWEDVK